MAIRWMMFSWLADQYLRDEAEKRAGNISAVKSFEAFRSWVTIEAGFYTEYPRLKDTEIFKALGVTETTWRRNYKLFFDRLVEHCHIEESFAEKILRQVTC